MAPIRRSSIHGGSNPWRSRTLWSIRKSRSDAMVADAENLRIGSVSAPAGKPEVARNVIVPRRHPGRWLAVTLLAVIALQVAHAVAVNENFHWDVYLEYLFW